jgi:hypothetical protein
VHAAIDAGCVSGESITALGVILGDVLSVECPADWARAAAGDGMLLDSIAVDSVRSFGREVFKLQTGSCVDSGQNKITASSFT